MSPTTSSSQISIPPSITHSTTLSNSAQSTTLSNGAQSTTLSNSAQLTPLIGSSNQKNMGFIVGLATGMSILGILLIAAIIVIVFVLKRRKRSYPPLQNLFPENRLTTSSFHDDSWLFIRDVEVKERLGGGNFSDVYKGF